MGDGGVDVTLRRLTSLAVGVFLLLYSYHLIVQVAFKFFWSNKGTPVPFEWFALYTGIEFFGVICLYLGWKILDKDIMRRAETSEA
jgi:hypothetical protein